MRRVRVRVRFWTEAVLAWFRVRVCVGFSPGGGPTASWCLLLQLYTHTHTHTHTHTQTLGQNFK